jgi:anti-sigma factor RsiW
MSSDYTGEPAAHTNPNSTDCDQLRELLPAYSVGATDSAETRFVEAALPGCPEVAAELGDYVRASQALYGRVPSAAAVRPAGMEARFKARLAALEAGDAAVDSTPPASTGRSAAPTLPSAAPVPPRIMPLPTPSTNQVNRRLVWAALVAAALLLFTNAYWITRLATAPGPDTTTPAGAPREVQVIAGILGGAYQTIALGSTVDGSAGTVATVLYSPASGQAALLSDKLPVLSADQTYQLWLLPEGASPVSAGVFQPTADGTAYIFEPAGSLDGFSGIAISTEPAGGSPAPTTNPIALGTL